MVKKLRYRVVVKGVTISRHTKKMLAVKKASSIYGAKVLPLSTRKRKTTTKRKSRSRRW